MTETKIPRRSKSLVDPEVQGSVLRKIALHWFLLFMANSLALVAWVRLFEQPDASWGETFQVCVQRYLPFFVVSFALIPAFVWDTLKLTNRFAGPILRLRNALRDAAEGRPVTPIHFRQNDFWGEIAKSFNVVMQRHATQVSSMDATNSDGSR